MKLTEWPLMALFAACFSMCFSANAADLFFIVGQVDPRGQSQQSPAEVKLLSWTVGTKFTSIASQVCNKNCPDADPVDGIVPAFASTWTGMSKNPAHFLIYRKPNAALIQAEADDKGYWTDFDARKGIYQDALTELRKAQQSAAFTDGIKRRYLIWMQNETDARGGFAAKDYHAKLIELFDRFNKDLGADSKQFDAMFIVSSGLVRTGAAALIRQNGTQIDSAHVDKVNAIVQAQDSAAAQGKIVMISRSMRRNFGECAGNVVRPGCTSKDHLRYYTWSYETLGAEMARNAFTYHSKGIKPLLPDNCKKEPTSCAGTVDVYRWMAKGNTASKPIYGTDPYEFDDKAYHVTRLRLALFHDSAPGRIPLYRNAEAGGPGISTAPGSTKASVLGYCYASPTGSVNARLTVMQQDGLTGLARQPAEASEVKVLNHEGDKTLCYVS